MIGGNQMKSHRISYSSCLVYQFQQLLHDNDKLLWFSLDIIVLASIQLLQIIVYEFMFPHFSSTHKDVVGIISNSHCFKCCHGYLNIAIERIEIRHYVFVSRSHSFHLIRLGEWVVNSECITHRPRATRSFELSDNIDWYHTINTNLITQSVKRKLFSKHSKD